MAYGRDYRMGGLAGRSSVMSPSRSAEPARPVETRVRRRQGERCLVTVRATSTLRRDCSELQRHEPVMLEIAGLDDAAFSTLTQSPCPKPFACLPLAAACAEILPRGLPPVVQTSRGDSSASSEPMLLERPHYSRDGLLDRDPLDARGTDEPWAGVSR